MFSQKYFENLDAAPQPKLNTISRRVSTNRGGSCHTKSDLSSMTHSCHAFNPTEPDSDGGRYDTPDDVGLQLDDSTPIGRAWRSGRIGERDVTMTSVWYVAFL